MKLAPELTDRILAMPGVLINGRPSQVGPERFANEKAFQQWLTDVAESFGWKWYHVHDSRRSKAGFPDLVLWRERVLFVEVKMDNGVVTAAQANMLDELRAAGAEAYLWRPVDRMGIVEALKPQ